MKQFTKRDESFICENCGKEVGELGYTSRDHCPHCLCSIQVEINNKKGYVIVYKCDRCGAIRKNKAANDDNEDLIIKLTVNNNGIL